MRPVASAHLEYILPTTVLTGFLGSGKTSLLRRALVDPGFTDTAVIVNEVGAVAIDHYLVDFVEGAVLELPGGCLCCAVREDVARTLRDLIDRRDDLWQGGSGVTPETSLRHTRISSHNS